MKEFRTVLPDLRKYFWPLVAGLAALLVVDVLQLLIPRIIKWVVDDLIQGTATGRAFFVYALEIIGISLVIGIFRYFWRYFILGTSHRIERNLRLRLFTHLQRVPLNFFHQVSTGDIMAHATNDLGAVRMALGMALVALVDGVILTLMAVGFMVHINLELTLYTLIPAPLLVISTNRLTTLTHQRFLRIQETFSELTEKVRENFAGIRVVKAYVQESHRLAKLEEVSDRLVQANLDLTKVWGLFFPLVLGIINLSLAIVMVFGGRKTILLAITPGDFVAFMSYLGILTWPLVALGWVMNILERGAASMDRINRLLATAPEVTAGVKPGNEGSPLGGIEFQDVSFSYDGRVPVLQHLTFTINPGERVAIVGRVGSGKTTVLDLLLRLYEAKEGRILIGGFPIEDISLEYLRQQFSYIPQDTFLFSDTLRENIVFGMPGVPLARILEVTKVAQIHEEIMAFPAQCETIVGERGVILSGGQKQRIAIARALLLDAPILIFDNALSSVDTYTEERIMANLKPLLPGKTTIVVTHRISSIKDADRIYVLDEGMLVQQGTHESLLAQGGIYSDLFARQMIERELEKNQTEAQTDGR
jgi:ATP-binding cassette, subfamily B, multidrug efflux pump